MLESMATKSNPRKDLNQTAFSIMQQATGEVAPLMSEKKRNPSGVSGGLARAAKLTPEQRIDAARTAANSRWKKNTD